MANTKPTPQLVVTIQGMDCAGCARTLETGVGAMEGVTACQVNFFDQTLSVEGEISAGALVKRVQELGYEVKAGEDDEPREEAQRAPTFGAYMWQRWDMRMVVVAAALLACALLLEQLGTLPTALISSLFLAAMLIAGHPVFARAWRAARHTREINIDVLMTIAAIGAVAIGTYGEAAMVVVLFSVGEALEGFTGDRARHAIRSLMAVVPETAVRLLSSGGKITEEQVAVSDLRVADRILVRPGERIPMDGVIRHGISTVDQAAITGESRLIETGPGSEVYAGSINGSGAVEVEVTRLAAESTISRMVRLVSQAQANQAPVQRTVDRFARIYTPAVVILAVLVATVPPLIFGQPFVESGTPASGWLYRGLALLIVACPCALVISTPVTIVSAISSAARGGVLFKGGSAMEQLGRVRTVIFDKTGTLTAGAPSLVGIRSLACRGGQHASLPPPCADCHQLLALASAVERRSEHPLAQAIVEAAGQWGVDETHAPAGDVTALSGLGIMGQIDGHQVIIASHRYFETAIPHDSVHCRLADQDAHKGFTPLMVSFDGSYQGTLVVGDTLRANSSDVLAELRQAGAERLVMLTGDGQSSAATVGSQLGFDEIRAELLPEDKMTAVEEIRSCCGPVAMVGDGINDAPALASADVGIAVAGPHGRSNQAMETADVTLMAGNLAPLPSVYRLSQAAVETIRQNIGVSIGIKILFLILVVLGMGTMWMAVLADMGTSLLVTLNGLRLLRWRPD